ncbi:MAG TPA: GPP34 family phosphoprotein [Micromonosporaceae bacterium]|nr:GPP34 family phosphoprotein [Micromonosporaceae bacterium]
MDPVPPLSGEYFLLAHDDYSGRPHINQEVLSTGLAGALLAQLLSYGRIEIVEDDKVRLLDARPWDDEVTNVVVAEIGKQTAFHPARAWVEYLRGEAYSMVGEQLAGKGLLNRETGMLRRSVRYVSRDPIQSARPRVRLRYIAQRPHEPLDEQTATLAALVLATKLDTVIADGGYPREIREGLEGMSRRLRPDMLAIVAGVTKAVTAIALSVRGR